MRSFFLTMLLFLVPTSVLASTVEGEIQQGRQTYYCEVYNSSSIRSHVLYIEYFYQAGGQWYSLSRRCDADAGGGCEINPGNSLLFDSRIQLNQYPITHCRAHLGPGRW